MSFSSDVKEKAMLACGRRCCLCHKFCGVRMECHHMVEAANGGEDTFDNCIPLCFDCHAEVGHYNNKHPKGIKFSAAELKSHRDRWYSKAQAIGSDDSSDNHQLDVKLFYKACQMLGGSGKMLHFRDHDYGNLYAQDVEKRVGDFLYYSQLPEWEFFNAQMDCSLSDLRSAVGEYVKSGRGKIWFESDGWAGVPQEWQDSQEARFDEAVSTMNKVATEVWDAYALFIREGRRVLKVDPEDCAI